MKWRKYPSRAECPVSGISMEPFGSALDCYIGKVKTEGEVVLLEDPTIQPQSGILECEIVYS